jgi:MFS family permease
VVALTEGDPGALAWVSAANCATVVLGLPAALRVGARLTPYASIRWTVMTWAAAWTLCLTELTGLGPGPRVALPVAAALVGAGELLLAAALSTLVNALAKDELRGRYNAALTMALTVGVWAGPVLASVATGLDRPWLLFVAALLLLVMVGRAAR